MGGAERSSLALARWLRQQGVPVHVVSYTDRLGLESFSGSSIEVVQLRPRMDPVHKISALHQYFASRPKMPRPLASGYQPALHLTLSGGRGFHCLMHDTPSLLSDARGPRTPRQKLGRAVSDRVVAHGLRSGGRTIVTSDFLRTDCQKIFGVAADIVRMGGLSKLQAGRVRPFTGELRMLSVSRLEPNKRIDWIVRTLSDLEKDIPTLSHRADWRLDVVGEGSQLEGLRTLSHHLGLHKRVRFHGYITDSALEELYDQAHLFLMPAIQGYGIPAIESLQRGTPVLLHRDSGVSDILLDTPWATVFDGDEKSLRSHLLAAINGVCDGRHLRVPPPMLPTEDAWAEEVSRLCGWV